MRCCAFRPGPGITLSVSIFYCQGSSSARNRRTSSEVGASEGDSAASAIARQWFLVTMSVVVGRVAYLAWKHGFRLAMMWVVKLATDPGIDLIAYTPLRLRRA